MKKYHKKNGQLDTIQRGRRGEVRDKMMKGWRRPPSEGSSENMGFRMSSH